MGEELWLLFGSFEASERERVKRKLPFDLAHPLSSAAGQKRDRNSSRAHKSSLPPLAPLLCQTWSPGVRLFSDASGSPIKALSREGKRMRERMSTLAHRFLRRLLSFKPLPLLIPSLTFSYSLSLSHPKTLPHAHTQQARKRKRPRRSRSRGKRPQKTGELLLLRPLPLPLPPPQTQTAT